VALAWLVPLGQRQEQGDGRDGVDHHDLVDPTQTDLASRVAELTDGHGADVAFDAAGVGVATLSAITSPTPGGRLVVVALHEKGFDLTPPCWS
jgi:threonine dehydrogenase-like Zn-dependent dehydrogenase